MSAAQLGWATFGALCAGVVDAIAGGGGLITLPVLLALGMPPHIAVATNKGQAVFGGMAATLTFWKRKHVDRTWAPVSFVSALLGGAIGARLVLLIDPKPLKSIVLFMLVGAAAFLALKPYLRLAAKHPSRPLLIVGVIGSFLGCYDGFFGPGTGSLIIIALSTWAGNSMLRASGNAKLMNVASGLAALCVFVIQGKVLWAISIPMALANILGQTAGAHLAMAHGDRFVRFTVLTVVSAIVVKLGFDWALS